MFSLRILGGPIPKAEKVLIDVTPSTTFEAMFPMIQHKLFQVGAVMAPGDVNSTDYELVELEFVEGGKARPARVLRLLDSPKTVKLLAPALFLRPRGAPTATTMGGGGSAAGLTSSGSFGSFRQPGAGAAAVSPTAATVEPGQQQSGARLNDGDPTRFLPSTSLTGRVLPALMNNNGSSSQPPEIGRQNSLQGSFSGSFRATPHVADGNSDSPGLSRVQSNLASSRTVRERLCALLQVAPTNYLRGLVVDRLFRRAQQRGKVELVLAFAEKGLVPSEGLSSSVQRSESAGSPSSSSERQPQRFILDGDDPEFAGAVAEDPAATTSDASAASPQSGRRRSSLLAKVVGSPTNLVRRLREEGLMASSGTTSSKLSSGASLLFGRSSALSMGSVNVLMTRLLADTAVSLAVLFRPENYFTHRVAQPPLAADYKAFVFEAGLYPKTSVSALALLLLELKCIRRDFERFEQQERFRGERAEWLRYEVVTRNVLALMFYAHWCNMQQGLFAVHEQDVRYYHVERAEARERRDVTIHGFASFESAVRRGYVESAELRHRLMYTGYHAQSLEHMERRRIIEGYWLAQRLLELERDFSMASQVMLRVFHRALVRYREMELEKLSDLERVYRMILLRKEWKLRLSLFEVMEQLYRQWLEQTMLTWLLPVVEKIAAKAVADGKILLSLEMKEMRNVRAREEARLRVLMRQNSVVNF